MNLVLGPYWSDDELERHRRAALHLALAAHVAREGWWPVLAPVPFGHFLELFAGRRWSGEQWLALSRSLIPAAAAVHILALPELRRSSGTRAELEMCRVLKKEVLLWAPNASGFTRVG